MQLDKNTLLWIIYGNIVLYALCFQIQRPLEPFLVERLITKQGGDSSQEYARLQSFFSILQTIGSIVTGRFLDYFGFKWGFIINFACSALCYALLANSTSISILYASKIPAFLQCGYLCAQLAISQITSDGPERVKALGFLSMSYTIGAIIGPSVGGFIGASGDYYFGAKIAVVGSLISLVLSFLIPSKLPEPNDKKKNEVVAAEKPEVHNYLTIIYLVWIFLFAKVFTSVAISIGTTVFPLVLKNDFHVDEKGLGVSMSIMSACNALTNGFFLDPAVKFFGSLERLIFMCLFMMTNLSVLQTVILHPTLAEDTYGGGLYQYLLLSILIGIFQYILATTITSESTTRVGANSKGTLLGIEHSLFALARIVTPQLGIYILNQGGICSVSFACALIFGLVALVWKQYSPNSINTQDKSGTNSERKEK